MDADKLARLRDWFGTSEVAFTANGRSYDRADMKQELSRRLQRFKDANDVLAGANPYLRMFGTVIGGWLLAKSAQAAESLMANGTGDRVFLDRKVATTRFYANQILPQAAGLLPAVTAGVGDRLRGLLDGGPLQHGCGKGVGGADRVTSIAQLGLDERLGDSRRRFLGEDHGLPGDGEHLDCQSGVGFVGREQPGLRLIDG